MVDFVGYSRYSQQVAITKRATRPDGLDVFPRGWPAGFVFLVSSYGCSRGSVRAKRNFKILLVRRSEFWSFLTAEGEG